MTDLLYQRDSYLKEFQAKVKNVDGEINGVELDRTAFYPGGGGQPNDLGEFVIEGNSINVINVIHKDGGIWHIIEGGLPEKETMLLGKIDWDRRYKLMRTHTAMHALSAVVFRDYGALVTGGNMEPLKARMDFEVNNFNKEFVKDIQAKVNEEISKSRSIAVRIIPRDEAMNISDLIRTKTNLLPEGITEIRTVSIEGLDFQADGGTHVGNTTEIGRINLVDYKSKGKINKRVYVEISD